MSDLQTLIKSTLGVVPAPAPPFSSVGNKYSPSKISGWAPERPDELYEYRINVYRSEYGSACIQAADASAARDDFDYDNIDWDDCGDTEINDVERISDYPTNQHELDMWDAQYGKKHDTDGQPKCSGCETMFDDAAELTLTDDEDEWLCAKCLPTQDEF